ncbi:MAG: DUF4426 domain-containing protein [Pseudomonadota bacterium]
MQATVVALGLLTFALCLPILVQAQQFESFGQYEVHYSTLNTNQLTPQVAQAFGIQRAGTQAMLNISVIDSETGDPVEAEITASATNLTGQLREVNLRELREQEAVYYIGQFRIHNEETLRFEVQVQPEGRTGAPFELNFRHQFFTG